VLRSTFKHLRAAIREPERRIWERGVLWLEDYIDPSNQLDFFSQERESKINPLIEATREAISNKDAAFFANELDPQDWFRVVLEFPEDTLFLDIETTGLSKYYDIATIVGWSLNGKYSVHVRGQDDATFRNAMRDACAVVTYNGTLFDIPFVQKEFPGIEIPPIHVDLRFAGKRVGLVGGQKKIETELGMVRSKVAQAVEGEFAPVLWAQYMRGDVRALRRLITYNHADVTGLKFIFDEVAARTMSQIGAPRTLLENRRRLYKSSVVRWSSKTRKSGISLPTRPPSINPKITAKSLLSECGIHDCRIVGIDLTGSEARPTGWCLLEGSRAVVKLLSTDDDLVRETVASKPHLVSIDSPLSLPTGRKTAFDDDPGRSEFGIMRHSERVLKKRGINVYPALIPSMQRLTARGMNLADRFRKLGLPVIESYPGAAQDIMGIPRKRAGLHLLKQGLGEFGVRGQFLTKTVSHDEVDAVTSAIVGLFFFAGRFERLGKDDEEALIIPDMRIDPAPWRAKRVFGFSGPLASGKTTAALHLKRKGFEYGRYSMVLAEELDSLGKKPSRKSLQEFGLHVNRELGQRWLGRKLLIKLAGNAKLAIDGMRFPEDHALLVESFGSSFVHVFLESSKRTRESRYEDRDGEAKPFSEADSHEVEHSVSLMKKLAHRIIKNQGGLSAFLQKIDELEKD